MVYESAARYLKEKAFCMRESATRDSVQSVCLHGRAREHDEEQVRHQSGLETA
jgi:hypothetical protein